MDYSEEISSFLLECNAINFQFNPPFTYTSGLRSPIYLDNRKLISYPKVRTRLLEIYCEVLKESLDLEALDMVSATATAAIPMGALLAHKLDLPFVYVRSKAKEYGLENQIEGSLHTKNNVLVIEDHISTAKSVKANVEAIRAAQGTVHYIIATTSYENPKALKTLEEIGVEGITLAKGEQITEYATKKGCLTFEEKQSVDLWFKNPEDWFNHFQSPQKY
ncbi:MAG: Orotate phosphoribosyltransferase [Chlamydiae bacterium]|nr:Orotate phosphoribosyltransferase [Chlamydiota bacterium]